MLEYTEKDIKIDYDICDLPPISGVNVKVKYYIHKRTGARILFLLNSDDNKSFYIAQRTLPENDKGIPHIIEHMIMASATKINSENIYTELSKRSLCNYINALTYADKTVFAFSTINEYEYEQIINVLADAVYNANVLYTDKYFLQEGINVSVTDQGKQIKSGIVYNEMLGSYGSENRIIRNCVYQSLFPDNSYRYDSGGNPNEISKLSYYEVKEYYKKYYVPSNSYIYFYGNIQVEKYLGLMNTILVEVENRKQPPIQLQAPFSSPKILKKKFPFKRQENRDCKYVAFSYVLGTSLDEDIYQAYDYLDYLLVKAEGAVIKEYFMGLDVCSTVTSLFETGVYQPFYSIIFYDVHGIEVEELKKKVEQMIANAVKNHYFQENVSSLFPKTEFEMLEMKSHNFPLGIHYGITCLDSWIYDQEKPVYHLGWKDTFQKLKRKYKDDYFEKIVERTILNNKHSSTVVLENDEPISSKEQSIKKIMFHLPKEVAKSPLVACEKKHRKVPILHQDVETNDIAYLNFIFDITDIYSEESMVLYRLHSILLGIVDIENNTSSKLQKRINELCGGFRSSIRVYPNIDNKVLGTITYEIEIKVLNSKIQKAIELVFDILCENKFNNTNQILQIIKRQKANNSVIAERRIKELIIKRSLSNFSFTGKVLEQLYGIDYYRKFSSLLKNGDGYVYELQEQLRGISTEIISKNRLSVSVIGKQSICDRVCECVDREIDRLGEQNNSKNSFVFFERSGIAEAIIYDSSNCNIAVAGRVKMPSLKLYASLMVLKTIINYDYLFPKIRNECGAYGASFSFDLFGNIVFNSCNNSFVDKSIDIIMNAPDYIEKMKLSKSSIENAKIGALRKFYSPLEPYEVGKKSYENYLMGLDSQVSMEIQKNIVEAKDSDVRNTTEVLREVLTENNIIVSGTSLVVSESKIDFFDLRCDELFIRK